MIKLDNNKVFLNESDFKAMSGIWGAFRDHLDYCAKLLKHGNDNSEKYLSQADEMYLETVDPGIKFEDYEKLFTIVFVDKNYEVVNG